MEEKYPISELVRILGVTRTAVVNKIKKYSFNTIKQHVNGIPKTLVILSHEQLEALKIEVQNNKGVNTIKSQGVETKLNNDNTMSNNGISEETLENVMTNFKHYVDKLLEEKDKNYLLLTDKVMTQEKDAEHWKNQYFEIEIDKENLQIRLNQQNEKVSLKDNEINALKKQIEEIKLNQVNQEEFNKIKKDNEILSAQIAELLIKREASEKSKKRFLGLFKK